MSRCDILRRCRKPKHLITHRKSDLIPEIIGRLPVITYLEPLSREALRNILTEPKNALVKQYKKLLEMDGVELKFDDEMLDYVVDKALEYKLGARGLRALMETIMMDVMYETPGQRPQKNRLVITKEFAQKKIESADMVRLKNAL